MNKLRIKALLKRERERCESERQSTKQQQQQQTNTFHSIVSQPQSNRLGFYSRVCSMLNLNKTPKLNGDTCAIVKCLVF